jgi:hypothetical protein
VPFYPVYDTFVAVSNSFSKPVIFNKKALLAVIVPQLRKDGLYFEVNIKGYPRFFMAWSALGRFDIINNEEVNIPYELVLAVSDVIEKYKK